MCHDPEEGNYPWPRAPLVYDIILPLWEILGWIINFLLRPEKYELRKRQTYGQLIQ